MQFSGQGKPSVGVVFDAGMGDSIDDALALALLYGLQGKNESRVISVSTTRPSVSSAAFCDILVRFYSGPPNPFAGPMAIGMTYTAKPAPDTPIISSLLSKEAYSHSIHQLNDTADPAASIRNSLSAQYDDNAIVVMTGAPTNLASMLALPGVKDLVTHKVRYLVVSLARPLDSTQAAAAAKLFAEWPTPIVASPREVGDAVPFPASGLSAFSWSPNHPVVDAYHAARADGSDAPSWAMTAALYAVRPKENYFKLSDPGTISVRDGRLAFTPSASGKHRNLIFDPAQKEKIQAAYVELASTKPVPRFGGRRGNAAAEKKQ